MTYSSVVAVRSATRRLQPREPLMDFVHSFLSIFNAPTALAMVALLGYIVGRWRHRDFRRSRKKDRQDIMRALSVSQEMEAITNRLRRSLATHVPAVEKFGTTLSKFEREDGVSWFELCDRADAVLKPVLNLSSEISRAYAELLQQMSHLATFAELRTDPLTGVANRRAFDESLTGFLNQQARYGTTLSVAMLDIDLFKQINDRKGHLYGDRVLQELAALLKNCVRDCDVLARFGGEEFIILMPHTELAAACPVAERIRSSVQEQLGVTVSIGLTVSLPGDVANDVLARADAALYAAKNAGRNCVFLHEGLPGRIVGIKPTAPKPTASEIDEAVAASDGLSPLVAFAAEK